MRALLAVLICSSIVGACHRRPIDATVALPAPGVPVPVFSYPALRDSSWITPEVLRGAPAVIALWSTHCPFQIPAMAAFDSLAREFRSVGVQFVLLADDAPGPRLDSALQHAPWRTSVDRIGVADDQLASRFDHRAAVSSGHPYRVEFVLPSFLLIDGHGTVIRRAFGPPADVFRHPLDSLVEGTSDRPAAT